jgi:hypothetical protein
VFIELNWKVVSLIPVDLGTLETAGIFRPSPNTGFFRNLDVASAPPAPVRLLPTIVYSQAIRRLLRRSFGIDGGVGQLPVKVPLSGLGAFRVNTIVRLVDRDWVTVTVRALGEIDDWSDDVPRLTQAQLLNSNRPVRDIARWTLGMVATARYRDVEPYGQYEFKPAIHLAGIDTEHVEQNHQRELIALLIREDPTYLDPQVVNRVWSVNEQHRKNRQELLLVDKQGLLYATADRSHSSSEAFLRSMETLEVAMLAKRALDAAKSTPFTAAAAEWSEDTFSFSPHSFSRRRLWNSLADEFGLRASLSKYQQVSLRRETDTARWNERIWSALAGAAAILIAALIVWLVRG